MGNSLKRERVVETVRTLAAANTLLARVIKEIVGNDVSSTINGSRLSTELLSNMAQQKYLEELNKTGSIHV